jgi:methionine synthase I (cobalamin-dependent)
MMEFHREALKSGLTVADGGWSTRLQMRGLPVDIMAETGNLTHGELIIGLTRDYVAAGARFITTNTFSANRYHLTRKGAGDKLAEINQKGAALAKEGIGNGDALVAGSIGPSGKILAVKEVTPEELTNVFTEQAVALEAGGADVIVLETFSEVAEILLALKAAKDNTKLPVITSMSFDAGPQRTRTMMGAKAEECAAALEDGGSDAVGCNCGSGAENMLPAVVALRANTSLPLWVKPNAGMPELEDGRAVYKQTPDQFATQVKQLLDAGANIIGGCCGTGPEHIAKLAGLAARR